MIAPYSQSKLFELEITLVITVANRLTIENSSICYLFVGSYAILNYFSKINKSFILVKGLELRSKIGALNSFLSSGAAEL
jgi:hypothetical protein